MGGVVDTLKDSLRHNVMVFFDTRFARQWRPSLLKEGGPGARGGEGRGRAVGSSWQGAYPAHLIAYVVPWPQFSCVPKP